MMPDVAGVVHALPSAGCKGAVAVGLARIAAHDDEPRAILQRIEQLAAVGMALHDLDPDRHGARLRDEETDIGVAALMGDIDLRESVAAHGIALIDGDVAGTFRLDDLAEGGKGVLRQRFNLEFHAASTLARLRAAPS